MGCRGGRNSENSGGEGKSTPRNYEYWHLRLNKNSINSEILTKVLMEILGGIKILGQEEKGKENGMVHFQITLKIKPKKTFDCMVKKLKEQFPKLKDHCFDNGDPDKKEWYVSPSTGASACWEYTGKEHTRVEKGWSCRLGVQREIVFPEFDKWWQLEIKTLLNSIPDDRSIHWYWSNQKGIGKTTFCKWCCRTWNVCLLDGKKGDVKNGVIQYKKNEGMYPEVCMWNIPADVEETFISYTALEQVKDALFYSGKFEGGMVADPCPHVIVFANAPPTLKNIDPKRFIIKCIDVISDEPKDEDDW